MLNLWGYADVLTSIGHHPVAFIVLQLSWNLSWGVIALVAKALRSRD